MLEVPDALKPLVPALRAMLAEVHGQMKRGALGGPVDYGAFERSLRERCAAIETVGHELSLAALDVNARRIRINDVEHARVGRHATTFMAQTGEVPVTRTLYRRVGDRNGPVVDVVALRVGAVDGVWLPGAARGMAMLLQQGTSREAEATAREIGRLPYCRSSFERVGHAVGEVYLLQREAIERKLIDGFELPRETVSISLSLDRVSVPMEEPRARPPGRPRKGAAKRPVSRVFRMAYCGTVTLHDARGEALHTIRYGTMPAGDAERLCTALADDVLVLRAKQPELRVALLCDGAPEMWNLLNAEFKDGTTVVRLLDFYHLIEKLAPAARVLFSDEAPRNLARWKLDLLNRSAAHETVLAALVGSGLEDARVGEDRPVHDAITYLRNNAQRMDYATARRQGLPIASGNVEATCKSLVGIRMKRSGARWKTTTGEHVIQLRALALSDRWSAAMDLTLPKSRVLIRRAA